MRDNRDQGGAQAIKGFNFQTAMGALIAVFNFSEPDFKMIVEGKEDLEVHKAGICTYVQVKSSKLTTNQLLKMPKDTKSGERRLAILYKLLSAGRTQDRYKLIVSNKFPEKDFLNHFTHSSRPLILDRAYQATPKTIQQIRQHMQKDGISLPTEILQHLFLYRAPFQTDLQTASRYICGVMNENNILTDNCCGHTAFSEIVRIIYQKSEYTENGNLEEKTITSTDLKRIFHTSKRPLLAERIIAELFPGQILKQDKIRRNIVKIPLAFKHHKENIKERLGSLKLVDSMREDELINKCMSMKNIVAYPISNEEKYAILIDLLLDEHEATL